MKNLLNKLILGLGILLIPSLVAQVEYTSSVLATNTPVELVTTPAKISQLILTASTANSTTFKFYDYNDTTSTNVVYAATTTPLQYSTNYSTTTTNIQGVVLTNTFTGLYIRSPIF